MSAKSHQCDLSMYVTSIFQFDVTSISLSLLSFVGVRERGLGMVGGPVRGMDNS